jgi:hypothetical protein
MQPGDLITFGFIYSACDLNYKTGLYLGEDRIDRSDGVTIINHKCWLIGEERMRIIDKGLLGYIRHDAAS